MQRRKTHIASALGLLCLTLLLLYSSFDWQITSRQKSAPPGLTSTSTQVQGSSYNAQTAMAKKENASSDRPESVPPEKWTRILEFHREGLKRNVPIVFYGRVIDQHDQPVEGAAVEVHVGGFDENFLKNYFQGNQAYRRQNIHLASDMDGRFRIEGYTGYNLTIKKVAKPGLLAVLSG